MTKKDKTAAELMAELEAKPEFVERRARLDEEHRKRRAELRRAEAPLVRELNDAGFEVESVWDLVNTRASYTEALPILLAHLTSDAPYPPAIRAGIARALAVRESSEAWSTLVRLYREESDVRTKDGLAVALSVAANRALIDELIELARDTNNGTSRMLLLPALTRSRQPQAKAALFDLASDPDLSTEIAVIRRRMERRKK